MTADYEPLERPQYLTINSHF